MHDGGKLERKAITRAREKKDQLLQTYERGDVPNRAQCSATTEAKRIAERAAMGGEKRHSYIDQAEGAFVRSGNDALQ